MMMKVRSGRRVVGFYKLVLGFGCEGHEGTNQGAA